MSDEKESSITRRGFIKGSIGAASSVLLMRSIAHQGSVEAVPEAKAASASAYEPSYFNPDEWAFITAATDRLIPSNEDGPGALDLGVPEFIDRQMETEYGHGARWYLQGPFHPDADFTLGYQMKYSPRDMYRVAIAQINTWCRAQRGKTFAELDGAMQDQVLGLLEHDKVPLENMNTKEFFLQLLANTKEGYFADPMYGGNKGMGSWKMIGFPGARADFKDWASQPGKVYPYGPVSILGEKA